MNAEVRLGIDRAAGLAAEANSGKRYRPAEVVGPDTFGELVQIAVRRRRDEPAQTPAPTSPERPSLPTTQTLVPPVDFGATPVGNEPDAPNQPQIGGPTVLPPPPTQVQDQATSPIEPPRSVPTGRLLGTRAEYQLDPESAKGSSYRGVAVRYWNVYSDGTKVMIEDWSRWTGTVDASLAKTDLEGGNVVGLVFGSPPPVNA